MTINKNDTFGAAAAKKSDDLPLAAQLIRKEIRESKDDRDALHDVIAELIPTYAGPNAGDDDSHLPATIIDAVIDSLTEDELFEAARWSVGDTCVRDNIFVRLRDQMPIEVQNAIDDWSKKENANG